MLHKDVFFSVTIEQIGVGQIYVTWWTHCFLHYAIKNQESTLHFGNSPPKEPLCNPHSWIIN